MAVSTELGVAFNDAMSANFGDIASGKATPMSVLRATDTVIDGVHMEQQRCNWLLVKVSRKQNTRGK